jgi:hypothetical protein
MGYRVGISEGLARATGIPAGRPTFFCDGCKTTREFRDRNGMPRAWFLDRRAAPGWKRIGDKDYCPTCVPAAPPKTETGRP